MRYSHAVASRGRKASARSHAERTVAAEFRACLERRKVCGESPVNAARSAIAPYHATRYEQAGIAHRLRLGRRPRPTYRVIPSRS